MYISKNLCAKIQCCVAKIIQFRAQFRLHFSLYFVSGSSSSPILSLKKLKKCLVQQHKNYRQVYYKSKNCKIIRIFLICGRNQKLVFIYPGILQTNDKIVNIYLKDNFGSVAVEPERKLLITAPVPAPVPQNNFGSTGSSSGSATLQKLTGEQSVVLQIRIKTIRIRIRLHDFSNADQGSDFTQM